MKVSSVLNAGPILWIILVTIKWPRCGFSPQQNLRTVEFCQSACLGAQLEAGSRLGHEAWQSHPADILIETLQVACVMPGSTAMQAE